MPAASRDRRLAGAEAAFGHRFAERALLREALTHASALGVAARRRPARSYERLEFLGDRVLGLVIAHLLIERFPGEAEGALTHRQVALVSGETLAQVAAGLDLGAYLDLARSEEGGGGRTKPALLADACEALIGALYLDGGLEAARGFILRHWAPLVEAAAVPPRDAKAALQEWAYARGLEPPAYRVLAAEGPAHAPHFTVEALLAGRPGAVGEGGSKRAAERAAALRLLLRVEGTTVGQEGAVG